MSKIKAVWVLCFLASLLAITSALECPFGERINGDFPNPFKECSSCAEFQCGAPQKVQYGCPEDALQACPAFKGIVSAHRDDTAFCSKGLDGNISYYFPGCKGELDYDACSKSRRFAPAFILLKNKCKELENGQEVVYTIDQLVAELPLAGATCSFGTGVDMLEFGADFDVSCSVCAEYQCHGNKKIACAENALKDCPPLYDMVETSIDNFAYCKKEADGKLLYYFPWCSCAKLEECLKLEAIQAEYSELIGRCKELEADEEFMMEARPKGEQRTICPRTFNFSHVYDVSCDFCVKYECWSFAEETMISRSGCAKDFIKDCWHMQHEIYKIGQFLPDEMLYCNDNVFYWSGCGEEASFENCKANGSAQYLDYDLSVCHEKLPGQLLWKPKLVAA